jgi:hypothetical protein
LGSLWAGARNSKKEEIDIETREVARGEWRRFLNGFSKQHQGEIASGLVIGEAVGVQVQADRRATMPPALTETQAGPTKLRPIGMPTVICGEN